ncbi:hypothetical protein Tco_0905633 [Tanacetum coccineum]
MFNEYFNPPPSAVSLVQVAATPRVVDLADSPMSTSIDQYEPSTSIPSTQEQEQTPIISKSVKESPKTLHFHDDPLHETLHEDSTSHGSSSNMWPSHIPFELLVEPKNYKEAMLEPSWIDAMQEEIHEFERLQDTDKRRELEFEELFEPVSRIEAIHIFNVNTATKNMTIYLMDVKTTFLNGLQISQSPKGIFINQSNYALEIIKKYGMLSSDPVDTPMVDKSKLDKDLQGKPVDPTHYRGMIGSLMYLRSSRPDLVFAVCMCAQYHAKPTEKHLYAVNRIFRYLKGTIDMGLWYSKDSCITLIAYADEDNRRCQETKTKAH